MCGAASQAQVLHDPVQRPLDRAGIGDLRAGLAVAVRFVDGIVLWEDAGELQMMGLDLLAHAVGENAAALVNFAAMILGLLRASKKENPLSAQLTSRVLFVVRMVVLLVVLVIALKSKRFDPLATLLPLCFMRLALMASELVRKKKKGVPAA